MKQYFHKIMSLTSSEWCLLLEALLILPVITVVLHTCGFKKTQSFLALFINSGQPSIYTARQAEELVQTVVRMVKIAVNYSPYQSNCLKYSVVLWWMLARKGIMSVIVFGINKEQESHIDAHAWVEINGVNVSDSISVQENYLAFQKPGS